MSIYILLLLLILLLDYCRSVGYVSNHQYCNVISCLFVLITGLRHVDVGSDTTVYYLSYERLSSFSSFGNFLEENTEGDIGYYILQWLMFQLKLPFWVHTLVISIFFYTIIGRLIFKYSKYPALSFLILMAFNFFQFSMTGIRQTIALGFACLALNEGFKENYKLLRVLLYILGGYLFHKSCAVCLLYLPILFMKRYHLRYFPPISIILILCCYIFRVKLTTFLLFLSSDTRFKSYGLENTGAGFTTYLLILFIFISCLFMRNKYLENNIRGRVDILLLFLGVIFQSTVMVQSIMFRIAWYFTFVLILIIPRLIESVSQINNQVIKLSVYLGILFMYLFITMGSANVVPYKFFWQ